MFIIMIISYIIVALLDTYQLFQKKEYRKLVLYYSFMLVSITVGVMIAMDVKVPSPAWPIKQIIKTVIGR